MVRIFGKAWSAEPPLHPVITGVTLLGLVPSAGLTGALFVEDRRRVALNTALDRLILKYGSGTVHPASMIASPPPPSTNPFALPPPHCATWR